MPHDAHNNLLQEGDEVILRLLVKSVQPGEDYCNCNLVSLHGRRPDGLKESLSAINTGVLEKIPATPPIADSAEETGNSWSSCFAGALSALKSGRCVAREGWNGKGMYLFLVPQDGYMITKMTTHPDHSGLANGAFIAMKTADNKVVPWLASQTDILADDWRVLPL